MLVVATSMLSVALFVSVLSNGAECRSRVRYDNYLCTQKGVSLEACRAARKKEKGEYIKWKAYD